MNSGFVYAYDAPLYCFENTAFVYFVYCLTFLRDKIDNYQFAMSLTSINYTPAHLNV